MRIFPESKNGCARAARIASPACISPIAPATGPTIPASRQLCDLGFVGRRLEYASQAGGLVRETPSSPGRSSRRRRHRRTASASRSQVSLIRNFAAGLSVASITKSMRTTRPRRVVGIERDRMTSRSRRRGIAGRCHRAAASTLGVPISACRIDDLAREIRQLDRIGIDERQAACARSRERPQGAGRQVRRRRRSISLSCHFTRISRSSRVATRSVLTRRGEKSCGDWIRRGL